MENNKQEQPPNQIDTGGGAYVEGSVDTRGGDFVGRGARETGAEILANLKRLAEADVEQS